VIGIALLLWFVAGAIGRIAYRRGGRPWPWMVLAVIGYCVLYYLGWELGDSGLGKLLGFLYLLVVFPLAYIKPAGLRRVPGHWQCPDCRCFNVPSTLVCDCGHRLTEEPGVIL